MHLKNEIYDVLKWIAIICLPAFKIAIPELFRIWGWPLGPEIADTLDVVAVLLGTLLGVSCVNYATEQGKLNSEGVSEE